MNTTPRARRPIILACLVILLSPVTPAASQEPPQGAADGDTGTARETQSRTQAFTDYEAAQFHLVVRRPVEIRTRNLPAATTQVAESIDNSLTELFGDAVLELRVDSLTTLRDRFRENTELLSRVPGLARSYSQRQVRRAPDLSWVEVHYRYELYPTFAELFVHHDQPVPQLRLLRWVPSGPYTGIVIFAKEQLPVHGEGTEALLQPALLPEIYTPRLDPILTPLMQPGNAVRARGVVAYTSEVNGATQAARAGDNPMYVMAHKIFGRHDTDIILHEDDAAAILASESARRALRNGRVAVIVSDEVVRTD